MPDQTIIAKPHAPLRARQPWLPHVDTGLGGLWVLIAVSALVVLPPFFYLIQNSLMVPLPGFRTALGLENYRRVLAINGWQLWGATLGFALGSSVLSIGLGFPSAWLLARTNVPFRQTVFVGAFLSLSAPLIVKGIGWILLLGPNNGLINVWLRSWLGLQGTPIELFSLGGMIFVEGLLWTPIALLLALPPLSAMDPALEEAASMCGASRWQTLARVTLPLARPAILAVLLLSFIRALEAFEVPLLIGIPGGVITVTTALFQSIHSGFVPRYGEASAYAVLLTTAVSVPLFLYYRATREGAKFATITGKGFRPSRIDLGNWKVPCALWVLIIPLSLCAPLLLMLWASFLPLYTTPSLGDFGRMSLANYLAVATRDDTVSGVWNSLMVGTGSASAVAASTFVLSWMVVRRRQAVRWLLDVIVSLPLGVSRHRARHRGPGPVPEPALHPDLWHAVDPDLRARGEIPALRHAVLLFEPVVDRPPARGKRAHVRGRHLAGAVGGRAAAHHAGNRGDLDLRFHERHPRPVHRGAPVGCQQRHRIGGDPRSLG